MHVLLGSLAQPETVLQPVPCRRAPGLWGKWGYNAVDQAGCPEVTHRKGAERHWWASRGDYSPKRGRADVGGGGKKR